MDHKPIKIGVKQGGGPPPGYLWNVDILDIAFEEAIGFLTDDQYAHLADQFKILAGERDPTHSVTQSVDAIENFHELRDKGGVLGSLNVRVFFYLDKSRSAIMILGAIQKQNSGPTPLGDKKRMSRRLRKYLAGEYE